MRIITRAILLLALGSPGRMSGQTSAPQVSITWPGTDTGISLPLCLKIKAEAWSPNGKITQVQFFAEHTSSIGMVTNPPFSIVWSVGSGVTNRLQDKVVLTAVASDSSGLSATSAPVTLYFLLQSPTPVLALISPTNGATFATTDTILLSAELLASMCDTGPEEFFAGTNSLGIVNAGGSNEMFTADTPVFSLPVSNLAEGDYELGVHYLGGDGGYCGCGSVSIHVARLAVASPELAANGNFKFRVITSFAGTPNVIESSTNLVSWIPIGTNQASGSSFTFTAGSAVETQPHFYRVVAPVP